MIRKRLKIYLSGAFAGILIFAAFPLQIQAETAQDEGTLSTDNVQYTMQEVIISDEESVLEDVTETSEESVSEEQNTNLVGEGSIELFSSEEEITYNFKVAGIPVNNGNAEDILGDGTAVYNAETNTLILNGTDLSVEKGNYGIRAEGSLNIELKGTNKIYCEDFYGISIVASPDGSAPSVKIGGDGSLEAYGSDTGILVKGSLTIGDNAKVTSTCGDITIGTAYGIRVNQDFTICDNAVVTAKSGDAPEYSYAVYSGNNLTVAGNAKVTAEAGIGTGRSCGTYVISNIYMKDSAQFDTKGADTSESSDFASESYGIHTMNMYVSGGTLNALGQGASGISAGIYTQNMEISSGEVTASSVEAKKGQSVGIQSTATLNVSGGTLNANSGDTTSDSRAIDASGEMKITGGEVNAVTGTGDRTYGICSDTISISGGSVMVEAKDAESQSRGIQSMNGIVISGGSVNVKSGNADNQSYGLQTGTTLDISGGKVIVSTGTASKSNAIYSGNTISIKDSAIEVASQGNGIYAPYGSINVGCTEVKADENAYELVGTRVVISALGEGIYADGEVVIDELLTSSNPENNKTVIEPLGYDVTIRGLDSDRSVIVLAGKSVNETYPDFINSLETTKEGYEFKGYYTDENCSEGKEYSFDTVVTSDITIYTKWEETPKSEAENGSNSTDTTEKDDIDTTKKDNADTTKENKAGAVKTGDSMMITLWGMLFIVSGCIIAVICRKTKSVK